MAAARDYRSILFSPEDIGILGSKYLEERRANKDKGVSVGLASMDKIFYPAFPGELISIIARPGGGKTGFMMRWARNRAEVLRKSGEKNKVVVYITLEQSVEELNAFNLAADNRLSTTKMVKGDITDAEWNECLKYAVNRRFAPLWNIGYSSMTGTKQIKIDIDSIENNLKIILEQDKIDCVFVDYLQRIPYNGRESKTVGISENVDALKTIAQQITKSPIIMGVQATRDVDAKSPPVPDMDDGQWTSNIEQSSDRVISLVRPINYVKVGDAFGKTTITGPNMLLINILKQKLGPANHPVWAFFQPEFNKLDELEMENNGR